MGSSRVSCLCSIRVRIPELQGAGSGAQREAWTERADPRTPRAEVATEASEMENSLYTREVGARGRPLRSCYVGVRGPDRSDR